MARTRVGLTLLLALLARGAGAQQRVDQRWPFDPDGAVRIVNLFGHIRVIGWDADSLAVAGQLEPGAGRFYATGDAQVFKVVVEAPPGAAGQAAGRAELEVRVPRRARVWAKGWTADIDVAGAEGTLDLNSVSGTIHVAGTPQDVTAETMNGAVEVAGGTARARAKTVSGNILLRGASQDLGATTCSGTIEVRAAGWQRGGTGVQRGKFESVAGAIRFEGPLARSGRLEFESQSGSVTVSVPAATTADFDLLTIGGAITNTLTHATPAPRAAGAGLELKFATGQGGAEVTVRSFKGAIVLAPQH